MAGKRVLRTVGSNACNWLKQCHCGQYRRPLHRIARLYAREIIKTEYNSLHPLRRTPSPAKQVHLCTHHTTELCADELASHAALKTRYVLASSYAGQDIEKNLNNHKIADDNLTCCQFLITESSRITGN